MYPIEAYVARLQARSGPKSSINSAAIRTAATVSAQTTNSLVLENAFVSVLVARPKGRAAALVVANAPAFLEAPRTSPAVRCDIPRFA